MTSPREGGSLGAYDLQQRLGSGSMGTVYRAIDRRSRGTVAVKVLHDHLARDRSYIDRFRREAHLASLMTSPFVVRVLEFGQEPRPLPAGNHEYKMSSGATPVEIDANFTVACP